MDDLDYLQLKSPGQATILWEIPLESEIMLENATDNPWARAPRGLIVIFRVMIGISVSASVSLGISLRISMSISIGISIIVLVLGPLACHVWGRKNPHKPKQPVN